LNEQGQLPQPNRDRTLEDVRSDFAGRVCPGGPYGEIDEWSLYDESFRRLVAWAIDCECFFEGLRPLKEGGREHDLTFDPASATWLKFTKSSCAGYVVSFELGSPALEPALPQEYFDRLLLQNEIFADRVTFVGIAGEPGNPQIITRQPDIPGIAASEEAIIRMMTAELGFALLSSRYSVGYQNSLAFIRDDVAVFDLRPANVVETPEGLIIPIDAIPCRLDEKARSILGDH
jgi:hypothetical protein